MNFTSTAIAYGETGYYTKIIVDYLQGKEQLAPFYKHPVSFEGLKAAIEDRKAYPTNRELLTNVLQKHYMAGKPTDRQLQNMELLKNNNCYTITTAHQPNIFTGHLYFFYKILHTIRLCEELKTQMPENDFVPVFYMGSEDADLVELGHVYVNGIKHEWQTTQTGAVGRMKVDAALIKILDEIGGEIKVHPYGNDIIGMMKNHYTEGSTIEQATFKIVNELFGAYGLLVLLPDDADYKNAFIPVIEKELLTSFSHSIVADTVASLPKEYKVQAGGRELNMFYLKDDSRERIVKTASKYTVQHLAIEFDEAGIINELHQHPDRFSPNVILRPVLQETLLPNIGFIGGGGEVAYWMELKEVFATVQVPFPVLILRNSFLLVEKAQSEKAKKLGFTIKELFAPENELLNKLVKRDSEVRLSLTPEKEDLQMFYKNVRTTAGEVDKTLQQHTEALEKNALRKIEALEKKMLRAEKKKFETQQRQLNKLRQQLFPFGSLQERIENFMPFYAKLGIELVKQLYENSSGLNQEFVILEEV